jgi:hypothetical protein
LIIITTKQPCNAAVFYLKFLMQSELICIILPNRVNNETGRDERMINKIIILVLTFCLLSGQAGATVRLEVNYSRNMVELSRLKESNPGAFEIYGEIIAISQAEIKLRTFETIKIYRLTPATRIFCNGQPAFWKALLPVTDGAFFEARLIVAGDRVIAADAFYYGEEAVINGWEHTGGELRIYLSSLTGERSGVYVVVPNANLPATGQWLENGRIVFVLYGIQGRIRGVFL